MNNIPYQSPIAAPKFTLRPYQLKFIKKLSLNIVEKRKIVAVAPTGSGKTKMFIHIAMNAISKGRPVIIISDATKIFDQIINEAGGIEIANGVKHVEIKPGGLYIAMAQTLTRRKLIVEQFNRIKPAALIIVDEAHMGTTSNILRQLTEDGASMVLGFTATPDARVAKHLPEIYNDCIVCCQVDELIQEGFLCSYKHHARDKANLDLLEFRNGEYTEESQKEVFGKQEVYNGLIEDLRKFPFKKAMIFVGGIKQCEELYTDLLTAGVPATRYHSQVPNADYELAKFTKLDMASVCVSVKSLSKGFDYSLIDLVFLNLKTESLPFYLQMLGRGSRPDFDTGKDFFQVVDYGDNWKKHGLYWDNRDWDTMWKVTKREKKGEGVAPVAMCPSCQAIIAASQRICQYCDFERPLNEKELAEGELIEVTSKYTSLIGKQISELSPIELAMYAKLKAKHRFAARIAKAQQQKRPGFLPEFANAMGYKPAWSDLQISQIGASPIEFSDIRLR